jgi:hypothetical protein
MVVLHSLESDESGLAARKTAGFKAPPKNRKDMDDQSIEIF